MKTVIFKNWSGPLVAIAAIFFVFLSLGAGQIYHQDEHRWAMIVNSVFDDLNLTSPHPPLFETLFRFVGGLIGYGHLRWGILVFGLFNLFLIYKVSLKLSGRRMIAYLASFLFAFNVYSQIAALQIDIDGALLPFFVLLGFYAYLNLRAIKPKKKWMVIFILVLILGFLTKLSFALFPAVLAADYLAMKFFLTKKNQPKINFWKVLPWVLGAAVFCGIFYFLATAKLERIWEYAVEHKIFNFSARAYFELSFKVMKSLVWLSPLLFWPVIFGLFSKETRKKYSFWYFYLLAGLTFYLMLFDFAKLTIERYLMFLIVPACLIAAEVLYGWWERAKTNRHCIFWLLFSVALIFSALTAVILSWPHDILPLNPKSAYVERLYSGHLNFLIPFSGGSGPVGFYFSALFIILCWLAMLVFGTMAWRGKKFGDVWIIAFIIFGLGYNLLFSGEFLWGRLYGSPAKLARQSVDYVLANPDISGVITYNDIGPYDLKLNGKYTSRFYTAPERNYTEKLSAYRGYYMIVDFPAIDKNGRYWPLIKNCPAVKIFKDKSIQSYIFNCGQKI